MRILVAITGASGLEYGRRLVEVLKQRDVDLTVVVSQGAKKVAEAEGSRIPDADYREDDFSCHMPLVPTLRMQ